MKKLFALLIVCFLSGRVSAATQELVFGLYTSEKASELFASMKPIAEHLEAKAKEAGFDVKIEVKVVADYESAHNMLLEKKFDLTRTGPASYVMLKDKSPGVRLLVVENDKGVKSRPICVITGSKNPIASLKELKGKTFAFGDNTSTSSYLAKEEMVKAGIHSKDLKSSQHLDRHDKVAFAVAAGDFDAGVCACDVYEKNKAKGLKEVARLPNMSKPWLVREGFDPKLAQVFSKALLALSKESPQLKGSDMWGFLPAEDKEFGFLRKAIKASEKF